MKTKIKNTLAGLLALVALFSCDQHTESPENTPPIQLKVVSSAVAKQLGDGLGDRFVKVGKVTFGKLRSDSAQNCYHVEVFYKIDDVEKREVITLIGSTHGDSELLKFSGNFPISFGKDAKEGQSTLPVTIDEMMNR